LRRDELRESPNFFAIRASRESALAFQEGIAFIELNWWWLIEILDFANRVAGMAASLRVDLDGQRRRGQGEAQHQRLARAGSGHEQTERGLSDNSSKADTIEQTQTW